MERNTKLEIDKKFYLKTLQTFDVTNSYVQWLNDYEVTKYTEQKNFNHTIDSVNEFVDEKYNSSTDQLFGIFYENIHIGNIKLGPIKFEHMSAEVSYFIGEKKFWGKGIASKCVETVVHFAVTELGLRKINAGYYENNIGSAKVFEKCGFVVEGVRISDVIFEKKRINSVLVGYIPKFDQL